MHRNISGVRFTVSFLALLLVVFLSACSSSKVVTSVVPSPTAVTAAPVVTAPAVIPTAPAVVPVVPVVPPVKTTPTPVPVAPKAVSGTFHEKVSYGTPEGSESLDFVFTVDSGVVSNLALGNSAKNSDSRKYVNRFMSSITSQVVGKKVSSIGTFSRVAGASLTTPAFNQAVAKLKAQS